jgi:heat shock protein HslJ
MRGRVTIAALVVIAIGLAGCGDDDDDESSTTGASAPATLDGREFIVTSADGYDLVADTTTRISFDSGTVSVNAGCNTMGGAYELDGDELTVGTMMSTQMACPPELMAQDEWVSDFLTAGTTVAVDGDTITLTGDDVVLTLTDREVAEPDMPLEGTTWTLDGIIDADSVSTVPGGVVATIRFEDGMAQVDTGCNTGSASAEVGDGTIFFGPMALTKMACGPDESEVEQTFVALLTGDVAYVIESDSLTLSNGQNGLTFKGTPA